MRHLRYIPILLFVVFFGTLEAQDCVPTIHFPSNYHSIAKVGLYQSCCRPERGDIIILPPEDRKQDHSTIETYPIDMAEPYDRIYFQPNNGKVYYYWTLWIDYDNDDVIDHANEIIKAEGKRLVDTGIRLQYTSTMVKFQVVMSKNGYKYPCSTFKRGHYLFTEAYIYNSNLSDKIDNSIPPSQVELDYEIYPNPVSAQLNVNIKEILSQSASVILFNAAGQKMKEEQVKLYRGEAKTSLYVDDLTRGIYHLQIKTGTRSTVKPVILQ